MWDPYISYYDNLKANNDPSTCRHPISKFDEGAEYCHGCASVVKSSSGCSTWVDPNKKARENVSEAIENGRKFAAGLRAAAAEADKIREELGIEELERAEFARAKAKEWLEDENIIGSLDNMSEEDRCSSEGLEVVWKIQSLSELLLEVWKEGNINPNQRHNSATPPVPMVLYCPDCWTKHLDEGEWATRLHKTHQCQSCGSEWRPANVPTVGVSAL